MPADLLVPSRMIIGPGSLAQVGEATAALGGHALVVTGRTALRRAGVTEQIVLRLEAAGVKASLFQEVEPEPSCETCDSIRDAIRSDRCDVVVGAGGGSAMDAAKAAAGLAGEEPPVIEFWNGKAELKRRGLPFVAIPTTSGTGAEATQNAVITNPDVPAKSSIRHPSFMAKLVVVDPYLMLSASPELTACSGMDALTQAIESFTSLHASPMTDLWSFEAMGWLKDSVPAAFRNGADLQPRSRAAYGSLLAGLALCNARLGLVHGLAHPIGARYRVPHGLVCAVLLRPVMRFNRESCTEKYARLDGLLGGSADAFIEDLMRQMNLPLDLKEFKINPADIPVLVEEALPSGSLKANPRPATAEVCAEIIRGVI